ncbi:anti-sigma factor family protein [Aestuariivirga sp.]|uniref:anti-sigma factor family protein n=1 Tax=Aestuariivirga sp. TaxID=2650926 RepID=UPI0039E599FF
MSELKSIETWALSAYVDGELEAGERDAVERLLRDNPEARATVEAYRQQNEALKRAYDGVLDEPVPPALAAALAQPARRMARTWVSAAAAVGLLAVGGLGGWLAADRQASPAETFADAALAAHEIYAPEVKHPVEVWADDRDHLQAWLSKRVGVNFAIPDLEAEGYALVGGRLLAVDDKPAAQIMYEDAKKQRITLLLTANPAHTETALRIEHKGPLISCYWLGDRLAFALAGEMDEAPMMQLARKVYDTFES